MPLKPGNSIRHVRRGMILLGLVAMLGAQLFGQVYVAPLGDDAQSGTFDQPLKTIAKAHSLVNPGDTIFVRGGRYDLVTTITLSKSGSQAKAIHLFAYRDEKPLLDFSGMIVASSNRGIRITGSYWYVKGLVIKGAGDSGMIINGSNNIIEFCAFFENRDTGLQLDNGASFNRIINCDSYNNVDPSHGNADGFAPKLGVGTGNYFFGCRAWNNSDDGWDGYLRGADDVTTTIENCWIFKNGYLKDGSPSSGNGNGIKIGGSDDKTLKHNVVIKRCLVFDNRVKGFDQNNNKGSMTLYNGTAYRNGTNYSLSLALAETKTLTLVNCLAFGSQGQIASFAFQQTNSWTLPLTVTAADFMSIDTTGVRGPRKADGSLPDVPFMHLAEGSRLIDAGTVVGIPFYGTAPDIGAFEWQSVTSVDSKPVYAESFSVLQNYPNPFNPSTTIVYEIPSSGRVRLQIVDLLGRVLRDLRDQIVTAGRYEIRWDGTDATGRHLSSGIYIAVVRYENTVKTLKLQLIR